jgi:2'-5' RNA ligase
VRLFIAIEFPEPLRRNTQAFARSVAKEIPDPQRQLRWVGENQLHLTLKFLGETPEEKLQPLAAALEEVAERFAPFSLGLGGLGSFGSRDHLRVIWLGMKEGSETAGKLAESVESACQELGFAPENRHFHPHITLARCKAGNCRTDLGALPAHVVETPLGSFIADHLALIKSTLTPDGPRYEILKRFPLKATG